MNRQIVTKSMRLVNRLVPKSRRTILFNSFPDVSDSSLALYEYIAAQKPGFMRKYRLIWLVEGKDAAPYRRILEERTGQKRVRLYRKASLKGIWSFFRSSMIVSTHGCLTTLMVPSQTNFNIWHGMPFKKIGALLAENEGETKDKADVTVATSPLFREIMAKAFLIPEENVYVTGYPRNDSLFLEKDSLKEFGIDREKYQKIIVWLPTYRKSVVGDIRTDGLMDSFGVREVFEQHFDTLDALLRDRGYLLIIKPHPMDVIDQDDYPSTENIMYIRSEELTKKNVQLYELLANSDSLITDYSSVFIDYLATDKPIAFTVGDIDAYAASRGIVFDPPTEYLPGEIIRNIDEFLSYLESYDEKNGQWTEKYQAVKKKFNVISKPVSSRLVFRELKELLEKR